MISKEDDIVAYRNKFYVCFDSDNDIHYYWLMRAWKQDDGNKFDFCDAHNLNVAYNTNFETIVKRRLKEQLQSASAFVVLIGERTRYLEFVKWEIEEALALDLPIICVNLNDLRHRDLIRCPPIISNKLSIHIGFNPIILQDALETWPRLHQVFKQHNDSSPYYYEDTDYLALGLGTSDQESHFENSSYSEDGLPKRTVLSKWIPHLWKTK